MTHRAGAGSEGGGGSWIGSSGEANKLATRGFGCIDNEATIALHTGGGVRRACMASDILSTVNIRECLPAALRGANIVAMQSVDSTSNVAKLMAAGGASHGTLVVAETQTGGRGRFSRRFHSPPGGGLYMSVVLRSLAYAADTPVVTIAAAVAVCRAVARTTGLSPSIKWVNDIMLNGKKICGILAETTLGADGGPAQSVVVGIGVNISVRDDDFPPEVRGTAGSLYPDGNAAVTRCGLAAAVYADLMGICGNGRSFANEQILNEYKSLSCVLGQEITFTSGNRTGHGRAIDIDSRGRLIVAPTHPDHPDHLKSQCHPNYSIDNGNPVCPGSPETLTLDSGEVSIRLIPPHCPCP